MSVHAMSWAFSLPVPPGEKLVLLALADRANDDGECWPGRESLATKCSMGLRTIDGHILSLQKKGLLAVEHRRDGKKIKTNLYRLFVGQQPVSEPAESAACKNLEPAESAPASFDTKTGFEPAAFDNFEPAESAGNTSVIQTKEKTETSVFLAAPSDEVAAPLTSEQKKQANAATWKAYSDAFFARYETEPVRNAKVNGQIAQLVARLGANEAPQVARFYLGHNDAYYVRKAHSIDCLLADAEKLRMEWATNRRITGTKAKQVENTQANLDSMNEALSLLQNRSNRRG